MLLMGASSSITGATLAVEVASPPEGPVEDDEAAVPCGLALELAPAAAEEPSPRLAGADEDELELVDGRLEP